MLEKGQFVLYNYITRYRYYLKAFPDSVFIIYISETSAALLQVPLATIPILEEYTDELYQLEVQAAQACIANKAEYVTAPMPQDILCHVMDPEGSRQDTHSI
jgi:hypothetical protein